MFAALPEHQRFTPRLAVANKKYKVTCNIDATEASYSIDDAPVAKCSYSEGTVPLSGHLGFAIYGKGEKKLIERVTVETTMDD